MGRKDRPMNAEIRVLTRELHTQALVRWQALRNADDGTLTDVERSAARNEASQLTTVLAGVRSKLKALECPPKKRPGKRAKKPIRKVKRRRAKHVR